MQIAADQRSYRLSSMDALRGLIIVIMALDHVRDFVMLGGGGDPMADPHVSAALFFTRWITHFCAPVFVFLAGASAGLMAARKKPQELGAFLLKRGLWLIFVEVALISTAFTFSPLGIEQMNGQTFLVFQVLWAIGASMIVLAALQFLGAQVCLIVGAGIVLLHNLLDIFWPKSAMFMSDLPLWVGLHGQMSISLGHFRIGVLYPVLPWIGVMVLGFGAARLFQQPAAERNRQLFRIGLALIGAFILLRALDLYGDPHPWHLQHDGLPATVMSFLNTTKYPPSLLYLLMTLGPAALVCSCADRFEGRFKDALVTFGRVPFAFYIAHFYLAHLFGVLIGLCQGFSWQQMLVFFPFNPKGFGLPLWGVYGVWLLVVATLYPFCRWVATVKARRSDWWLSYL